MHIFRVLALALALLLPCAAACADSAPSFDVTSLASAAQAGDAKAEFQLGTLDYTGLGVIQDYIGAINLEKQAATAGNAEAACEAGFLYQTGSYAQGPPPPDPADAAPWYAKAAAAGNACGEFGLGELYLNGQGVTKDPVKAASLLAQAAAQGLAPDPSSFPLQQLQQHFYSVAYQLTGQTVWVDMVSVAAGGGQ